MSSLLLRESHLPVTVPPTIVHDSSLAEVYLPNGDRTALWNGDAHLKATILGSSQIFDVDNGNLGVGTTGYVYFVDFDRTRSRMRKCKIIIIGE